MNNDTIFHCMCSFNDCICRALLQGITVYPDVTYSAIIMIFTTIPYL